MFKELFEYLWSNKSGIGSAGDNSYFVWSFDYFFNHISSQPIYIYVVLVKISIWHEGNYIY